MEYRDVHPRELLRFGGTPAAAELLGLADKFSHISTGGGASLEMLAGIPFKSVDLLDNA